MAMDIYKDKSKMEYKLIDKETKQEYILEIREGAKTNPLFYRRGIISYFCFENKYCHAFGHYDIFEEDK